MYKNDTKKLDLVLLDSKENKKNIGNGNEFNKLQRFTCFDIVFIASVCYFCVELI